MDGGPVGQSLRPADRLDRHASAVDEPAGPIAGLDEAPRGQVGEGPPEGVPGDVQARPELAFGASRSPGVSRPVAMSASSLRMTRT